MLSFFAVTKIHPTKLHFLHTTTTNMVIFSYSCIIQKSVKYCQKQFKKFFYTMYESVCWVVLCSLTGSGFLYFLRSQIFFLPFWGGYFCFVSFRDLIHVFSGTLSFITKETLTFYPFEIVSFLGIFAPKSEMQKCLALTCFDWEKNCALILHKFNATLKMPHFSVLFLLLMTICSDQMCLL